MANAPDQIKANRKKFLDYISHTEGTDKYKNPYNRIVGGKLIFEDFSHHPKTVGLRTAEGDSTAAGRYQIVGTTYDALQRADKNLSDFSPATQDEMALRLIKGRGALGDVDAGNFGAAIQKLGSEWASFPSANTSQPKTTWEQAAQFFGPGFQMPTQLAAAPTGAPVESSPTGQTTGATSLDMLRAMVADLQKRIDAATTGDKEAEAQMFKDYAAKQAELEQSDMAARQEVMNQPIQPEHGIGARMIGSLLGGGTEAQQLSDEELRRKQLQKQHDDLTALAISRNQRVADAYAKIGDFVNATKYTKEAQKLAALMKEQSDAMQLLIKETGDTERAGASARIAAQAKQWMNQTDYSKERASILGNKNMSDDQRKAALAGLRFAEQTPVGWARSLFTIQPGKPGAWYQFGLGDQKPLFNIKDEKDWRFLMGQVQTLFTPEELKGMGGEAALQELHDKAMGVAAPATAPTSSTPSVQPASEDHHAQAGQAISTMRKRANEIVKELASLRTQGKFRTFGPSGASPGQDQLKADALVDELNRIQKTLKLAGYMMIFPDLQEQGLAKAK